MNVKIITWDKIDNTIALIITWNASYQLYADGRDLGLVGEGHQVSAWHFPTLAHPIPAGE